MQRLFVWAIAVLSVSLTQTALGQSSSAPVRHSDSTAQTKQDQKAAKAKAKADKAAAKEPTEKKGTSSEDAAYAAAYKKGRPK